MGIYFECGLQIAITLPDVASIGVGDRAIAVVQLFHGSDEDGIRPATIACHLRQEQARDDARGNRESIEFAVEEVLLPCRVHLTTRDNHERASTHLE
jgi:hypothetical protein